MGIAVSASETKGLRELAPKHDCKLKEKDAGTLCQGARRRGHLKELKDVFLQPAWKNVGTDLWSLVQDGQPEACSPTAPSDPANVPLPMDEDVSDSIYPDLSQWRKNKEGAYKVPPEARPPRNKSYDHQKGWRAVIENASLKGDLTMQPILMPVARQGNAAKRAPFNWTMDNKLDYDTGNRLVRQQSMLFLQKWKQRLKMKMQQQQQSTWKKIKI